MARENTGGNRARVATLAAVVCLIALALTAWRTVQVFSPADARPAVEAHALTPLLEAVAGPGFVRITETGSVKGTRTLFILVDKDSQAAAADLKSIAVLSSGYDLKAGDQILIREFGFVASPVAPARHDIAELTVLALLVLASGALYVVSMTAPVNAPIAMPPAEMAKTSDRAPVAVLKSAPPNPVANPADLVNRDPARAADIVRAWMSGRGGQA